MTEFQIEYKYWRRRGFTKKPAFQMAIWNIEAGPILF